MIVEVPGCVGPATFGGPKRVGGFVANEDRDGDGLRDDWERTQPMAANTGYGPWTFDVPANPPKPAVPGTNAGADTVLGGVSFETQRVGGRVILSWGDRRADVAAKDAVNANKNIDAQDWSDQRFPPLSSDAYQFKYKDEDADNVEITDWITQKNNKDARGGG